MSIDCCKSYVGKQIIGLLPSESVEPCLYYLVINSQDLGAFNWTGWTIDGTDVYLSGYYWYPNNAGGQSLIVSYIGTQPTTVTLDDGFGNLYPFDVREVTVFGGSCENVCYQARFDYGYNLGFIDFFQLGGATPTALASINIDNEVLLEGYINTLLGTTNADVTSVWDGFNYVVTINNAYNLGGLTFNTGTPSETSFNVLPCEITPPAPVPITLLNIYPGASAAYSLRKLSTTYSGSAIRVRRSSDNTEQDIGFSGLDLDISAIVNFVGLGNGFVTKWYDQSGNNNHGLQTIANDQPRIVNSGTIDLVNSKPAVNFISSDLFTLTASINGNTDYSCFTVGRRPVASNRLVYFGTSDVSSAPYVLMHFNDGKHYISNRTKYGNYAETSTNQLLLSSFNISTNLSAYQNGVSKTLTISAYASAGNFNQIGRSGIATGFNSTGYIQEVIFYANDQSSNRVGIETNITNYYGI